MDGVRADEPLELAVVFRQAEPRAVQAPHFGEFVRDVLVGRHAVALLGHALRAGLATAVLDEARFAPLRVRPDFAAPSSRTA